MQTKIWKYGILCLILVAGCSPSAMLQKGDEAYDQLRYQEAITNYEKALEKTTDAKAAARLADSYRLTNQHERAEYWYGVAIEDPSVVPEVRYQYAAMLLANGKTDEARTWAENYLRDRPNDVRGQNLIDAVESRESLSRSTSNFEIQSLPVNAPGSDYAPAFWQDELIFASDRQGKPDPWTGRAYHSLYVTENSLAEAKPLPGDLEGDFHTSAVAVSPDQRSMIYTRSQPRREKGRDDVVRLSLYQARLVDGTWKTTGPFPYNSSEFSNMHPTISADGQTLIFASDRPGGVGGRDLYVCQKEGDSWGTPQKLPAPVNTPGNEAYPYLAADGTMYFASDGQAGLGGYDLFSTSLQDGYWTPPQNLGGEINSSADDISLITRDDLESGYFASNRNNADGTDDIFQFIRLKGQIQLNGIVVDEFTAIPLPGVEVSAVNQATGQRQTTTTGNDGRFSFSLEPDARYTLSGILHAINTSRETVITYDKEEDNPLFVRLTHNDPRFTLNGTTMDRHTQEPVEGVKVILYNITRGEETIAYSDAEGHFSFQLTQDSDFQVMGQKEDCFTTVSEATTKGLNRSTTLFVKLYLTIEEIVIGREMTIDSNQIGGFQFNNILYDFDDWRIRSDAARELDKLVQLLEVNPTLVIELRSHTDSRGDDDYNMELSQKRAQSAVDYIVRHGIDRGRITARGYGESDLENHCGNGVRCTDAQHQVNRRTEFVVLKY